MNFVRKPRLVPEPEEDSDEDIEVCVRCTGDEAKWLQILMKWAYTSDKIKNKSNVENLTFRLSNRDEETGKFYVDLDLAEWLQKLMHWACNNKKRFKARHMPTIWRSKLGAAIEGFTANDDLEDAMEDL